MKAGKEEDGKNSEPLFPRLSINDREIGGPRAPPRNKMALYEQLSIPSSKRLNSSTATPRRGGNLVTLSSSQGYRQHRSYCAPFDVPALPSINSAKRVFNQCSDHVNPNFTMTEFGRSSKMQSTDVISTTNGSAGISQQATEYSNAKKSCPNNINDLDDNYDCMVPTFLPSRNSLSPDKKLCATESRRSAASCTENPEKSSSSPSPNFSDESSHGTCANNMRSNNIEQNHIYHKDTAGSVIKGSKWIQDDTVTESFSRFSSYDKPVHPKYFSNDTENEGRCFNAIDVVHKGDASRSRKGSCSEALPNQIGHYEAIIFNYESENKATQSLELGDAERHETAEAGLPDSVSGMVISADDVVGVIGNKHFWKARKAIVNQQRIFSVQVFELHRLIKVQKLIAASPDVIKVDICINPLHLEVPTKNKPPEILRNSHHPTIIDNSSQNIIESTELPQQNVAQDLSAYDNRSNPWCFHPNANQWLVPVISPSEGLIYKPYSGPCPPSAGYMAPFYGNSATPMGFPMLPVNYTNQASGDVQYQQPSIYFPSYSLPSTNSIISSSVAEQVSLKPMSEFISIQFQKSQASKSSEVQGTTFASPVEKTHDEALESNGTNQNSEFSTHQDDHNRVIRVVPRKARLATESVARIIRSVQQRGSSATVM